ncbi:MAG: class I SAM-dependent rRNA methyltransferase [Ignavibacteriaceae bacterium]|nr:class I SAM-dependent rRNA methyltransferase [Ignavibacteriaceae bacterium]
MKPKIILRKNEERRILSGHQWIFSNEIDLIEGDTVNGDLVEVFSNKNSFLGTGFYNKNSLISVRLISSQKVDDLNQLLKKLLVDAFVFRKNIYPGRKSYRVVFSESDFLPGLIIDKYNNTFVEQIYCFGIQRNIQMINSVLINEFGAENIFTLHDSHFRKLEGLPEADEIYLGEKNIELIDDGAIKYSVDFNRAQKTGFFFDQVENRFFSSRFVEGKSVLDAFCNSGGFGLHACKAGAKKITFIDSSKSEIDCARNNFEINNFKSPAEFIVADVFDYLDNCFHSGKNFDVVMVDPPSFAKSKKSLASAVKGYEKLNKTSLQIINKNGFLITSSCSHHLSEEEFLQILSTASKKSERRIQLIHKASAALDHPSLPQMEETKYLKFVILRVLD